MKRWVLSSVIGDGSMANPYRAKAATYGLAVVSVIPSDPATGAPRFPWALCQVAGSNLTALLADPDIYGLPDLTKDTTLGSLTAAQRQTLRDRLAARGVDTSNLTVSTPFRAVLRRIGRHLEAAYHEDAQDVRDG